MLMRQRITPPCQQAHGQKWSKAMERTADTVNEDYMSPEMSPDEPEAGHGVRRVNNLPVLILGVAISIFLIIMVLVAADRANQQNKPDIADRQKGGNAKMLAKEI